MIKKIEINGRRHYAIVFDAANDLHSIWEMRRGLQTLCTVAASVVYDGSNDGAGDLLGGYLYPAMRILEEMDITEEEAHAAVNWLTGGKDYRTELLQPTKCKIWDVLEYSDTQKGN